LVFSVGRIRLTLVDFWPALGREQTGRRRLSVDNQLGFGKKEESDEREDNGENVDTATSW
jgi:hypothetical protein